MNKNNDTIYKKSEDRIVYILSSLILFVFIICSGCGQQTSFVMEENATSYEEKKEADKALEDNQKIWVYVCGAVVREDVYELDEGMRVIDAVQAAGGFGEGACTNAVNLSEKLADEQQIYIPTEEEIALLEHQDSAMEKNGVNINTADKATLTTLKGIGETRAEAIIEYRDKNGAFACIEDIMNVSGIGEASFNRIKDDIRVK